MTGLRALIKKELKEQIKSYKLVIVVGVFMLFGLTTPLVFYFLPYLVGEDIGIELPTFTAVEVLAEYASTLAEMGIVALILIGMGAIATERQRGTAAMTLCKPVGRGAFVIAKLVGLGATSLVGLALAGLACYGYTSFLFGEVSGSAFLALNLLLGLFFLTCLAVILLCSSLFKSQLAAGGLAFAVIIGQALVSMIPRIGNYTPGRLVSWGRDLVAVANVPDAWSAVGVSLGVIVVCLFLSWHILQRKEL